MRSYTTILNRQRRTFRLRPFEELWDIKMTNIGDGLASINVTAREAADKPAHVLLCTTLAPGATQTLDVPTWSRVVDYQTKQYLIEYETLETYTTVRLELVLAD